MNVGDIYPTKHWGDIEILEIEGWGNRCLLKFLLTGNVRDARRTEVKKGNLRDSESMRNGGTMIGYESPQREAAKLLAGDIFQSNFWGDVVVSEYRSSTSVDIEFVNSGNKYTVQLNNLRKGLVKDTKLSKELFKNIKDAEDASRKAKRYDAAQQVSRHLSKLKSLNKQIQSAHKQHLKKQQLQVELDKILQDTQSTIYEHPFCGKYNISRILDKKNCEITFHRTNGTQVTSIKQAQSMFGIRDSVQFPTDEALAKTRSAHHYQQNREVRLEQAKQWQKDNLDKARVRNRNRLARRKSAEGTHTVEEIAELLVSQNNRCNCCGVELDDTKHLDHIMPLCLGGSNWIENLQYLCQWCNTSKSGKHPDVWYDEIRTEDWKLRRAVAATSYMQ